MLYTTNKVRTVLFSATRKMLIIAVVSSCVMTGYGQKGLRTQGEKFSGKVIYYEFDGTALHFFKERNDSKEKMGDVKGFSLKGNYTNLYFKWLNPLVYKLTWKDSSYTDNRDQAINDFVKLLAGQFGTAVTDLNADRQSKSLSLLSDAKPPVQAAGKAKPAKAIVTPEIIIDKGFVNLDLTLLYLQLRVNSPKLLPDEIDAINTLTPKIVQFEQSYSNQDISTSINDAFSDLGSTDDPAEAKTTVGMQRSAIKGYRNGFKKQESDREKIAAVAAAIDIKDPLLHTLFNTSIAKFIDQSVTDEDKDKSLTNSLSDILDIFDASFKNESTGPNAQPGFFKARDVSLEDGKALETLLTISKYSINMDTKASIKVSDAGRVKLVFNKYDIIDVTISTGIFYSNATFRSYGVAPAGDEQFTVTEEEVNRNTAVTALFCNLNFGIGSRYFAPVVQLGIDPTKKSPFLLMGGGFAIPAARFAITGGGVWSWNQRLQHLTVGQTISSTSELEKDVKYNFEVKPRGYYIGVQYNF
jgi:hypothetical protein